ncbi:MAG: ORF6N domain-containing protein [Tyzzerella sp.]|nr:ORF6N domain-containing protein [Tyzzerella sp.]
MVEKEKMEVANQVREPLIDVEIDENTIKNLIYVVRGQQVMLDSGLAMLYQVETKRINEGVKRNQKRFPDTFCFRLSEEEFFNLKSQFATSSVENKNGHGGKRKLPYVFTEQGIAMLSAVLRSDVAIQVCIRIINTFVEMRRFMANDSLVLNRINEIEVKQLSYQKNTDERFDTGTLNILAKKSANVEVLLYTLKRTKLSQEDIDNFNQQYPFVAVNYTKMFHDRFLIIDEIYAYHIGASLKDAGKKCFAINKIEDKIIVEDILNRLVEKQIETS